MKIKMDCSSLVSIIVPIYCTEQYLPKCIDSIIRQSYKNIEIILIDDHSTDSCPKICDDFSKMDSRIIVIHQENKGVSGARNTGLSKATGDYIMFVDSDDELMSDAVSVLLNDANKYKADIVSASRKMMDKNGNIISDSEDEILNIYRDETPLLLSLRGIEHMGSACTKLFRSEFIENIRFEEGKNINEDGFFMFRCFLKKPVFVQHNVIVYLYFIRKESCSRQKFSDKYLSMLYFSEQKKKFIVENYPQYIDEVKNMEVRVCLQLLDLLCSTTDKKYKSLENDCISTVRFLFEYHKPINNHHKKLACIASKGLYPIYKFAVRLKYYR